MKLETNASVAKELRSLFNVGAVRELSDGQLLERFATDRGEAAELAFAVLVERHGPMVLRVCRSALADIHDIEDAFQATFLVLVQKARGLWVRDSLGPWLNQVAFRTASRARLEAARRRRHEECAAVDRKAAHVGTYGDLEALLHQEIATLPERYRAPVVLCDLEGQSQQQAARNLGWPVGTVKSRQARGREKLRDRLRRRGLAPNLGLLGSGQIFTEGSSAVPPGLIEATTRSVVQFVTCGTTVRGSTLTLAQRVLKAMAWTRWSKAASVAVVVGATLSGAHNFAQRSALERQPVAGNQPKATRGAGPLELQVKPANLVVSVVERGVLDARRHDDVFSNIKGTTTIIQLLPEGTRVKKGDIVCRLDAAILRDQLTNATIAVENAKLDYQRAQSARELAEAAVTAFVEGTSKQEMNALKSEVTAAESAIQTAERRLDRAKRARERISELMTSKKAAVATTDILAQLDVEDRVDASEQAVSREKAALELAKSKLDLLEKYTRDQTIKMLKLQVEEKRPEEQAKNDRWQHEQFKAKSLEKQIAACTIRAPVDGTVVYANLPRQLARGPAFGQIEEGATVRERQKILSVIDLNGKTLINTRVEESQIKNIKLGMKAKIRIDAFPGQLFDGTVIEVSALPVPSSSNNADKRFFATKVNIDNGVPGLRPGLTAEVEFLVAKLNKVLTVPVNAVISYEGKQRVAVKKPDGIIELREIKLGLSDGNDVEITHGIESGNIVILDRDALTGQWQAHEKPVVPTKTEAPR